MKKLLLILILLIFSCLFGCVSKSSGEKTASVADLNIERNEVTESRIEASVSVSGSDVIITDDSEKVYINDFLQERCGSVRMSCGYKGKFVYAVWSRNYGTELVVTDSEGMITDLFTDISSDVVRMEKYKVGIAIYLYDRSYVVLNESCDKMSEFVVPQAVRNELSPARSIGYSYLPGHNSIAYVRSVDGQNEIVLYSIDSSLGEVLYSTDTYSSTECSASDVRGTYNEARIMFYGSINKKDSTTGYSQGCVGTVDIVSGEHIWCEYSGQRMLSNEEADIFTFAEGTMNSKKKEEICIFHEGRDIRRISADRVVAECISDFDKRAEIFVCEKFGDGGETEYPIIYFTQSGEYRRLTDYTDTISVALDDENSVISISRAGEFTEENGWIGEVIFIDAKEYY